MESKKDFAASASVETIDRIGKVKCVRHVCQSITC